MDKKELFNCIPDYYLNSDLVSNIFNAYVIQLNKLNSKYENAQKQLSIHTADTDMYRWEQDYGTDNENYSLEYRRATVLSKIKGQATITKDVLRNILLDYAESVNIDVHNKGFQVEIALETKIGFSEMIDKISELILELIPADFGLKITLITNAMFKNYLFTASSASTTLYYSLVPFIKESYALEANAIQGGSLINTLNYSLG